MATNDTQFSEEKTDRSMRLLQMFDRLQRGSGISTKALQQEFGITAKSVQRDIGELRVYIAEAYTPSVYGNIEYNRIRKEYYWRNRSDMLLHEKEILLLVTILLESRGLTKEELNRLVDKMLVQCSPESEKHIRGLLKNELFLYKQTENAHTVKDLLWQLSEAKQQQRYVLLEYKRVGARAYESIKVKPLGIMFSEMYFYLLAQVEESAPIAFRLDRIGECSLLAEHFHVEYTSRFQPGEFRKEIQFMSTGELRQVKFRFWGKSLEAVLDRLPNAVVVSQDERGTVLQAEVYTRGAKMWFLSQAEFLEVMEPADFRQEMQETISRMLGNYQEQVQLP